MHSSLSLRSLFLSTAAACALAACGGGSDDAPSPPPPPAPPAVSPTCRALHSGTYRVIVPQMGSAPGEFSTDTMHINAVTGVTTATNDPTDVGQLTPTGNCTFSGSNGGEVVVSSGGVAVFRSNEGGVMRLGLAFPEQTIPVADLAGDWQMLGYERGAAGTYAADSGAATLSATGVFTMTRYCPDVKTCLATLPTDNVSLRLNPAGGFDQVNTTANWTARHFAYRAASGDLMMANISGNGSFSLWTQQRTLTLPTAGSRTASWGLWVDPSMVSANARSLSDFTNGAGDAATGSFTRVSNIDGHAETLFINNPHAGMSFRAEGTATATNGASVVVREFASLPLRGMGVSALSLPTRSGGAYFLSVTVP